MVIHERFTEPRPVGSGFLLQPTGLAVLKALGLEEPVRAAGKWFSALFMCFTRRFPSSSDMPISGECSGHHTGQDLSETWIRSSLPRHSITP